VVIKAEHMRAAADPTLMVEVSDDNTSLNKRVRVVRR
jgi:hypothetical protein